jgi:hypothetical protein
VPLIQRHTECAGYFEEVRQLGTGLSEFLSIGNDVRRAALSVAEAGWLVELWLVSDPIANEETLVREFIVPNADEAFQHTCEWLDGPIQVEP